MAKLLEKGRGVHRPDLTWFGIRVFDIGDPEQGISHVIGPELGLVTRGSSYACPDAMPAPSRRPRCSPPA